MAVCRAAVSQKLITILVLALVVAGGFWVVRCRSDSDVTNTSEPMTLYCPTCGKQETNEIKFEGAKFLCPKCNEYIATYEDPNVGPADIVRP